MTEKENEASQFQTALTERMNLRAPIVSAPIGGGASPQFLGAVAAAGALPFIALTHLSEDIIGATLRDCINHAGGPARFGINLALINDQHRRLDRALAEGVRVVSLWRGDPEPYIRGAKEAGATIFWTIGSPSEARRAADLGVDFLVAQGREAGGHLVGLAPMMSLLPAVVDAAGDVPVIAAGGIANGRGLAAALAFGACGVWMGTRFVASSESASHAGYKRRVIDAVASDVVETALFNLTGNSRQSVIRNSTFQAWEDAGRPPIGQRPGEGERIGAYPDGRPFLRYTDASAWDGYAGDWEACPQYAGASCELIQGIKSVRDIVDDTLCEARLAIDRLTTKTGSGPFNWAAGVRPPLR